MVRHPRTGDTFALVHAVVDFGCGGAGINLLGVYRASPHGALEVDRILDLGDVTHIDEILDIDRDGVFELVGDRYPGGRSVLDLRSHELRSLVVPFYGCPC